MRDEFTFSPSYIFSEIKNNGSDWEWWRGRIQQRINAPVQHKVRPRSDAINVLDEDWDTLVVIDACRADLFEDVASSARFDAYDAVRSNASSTPEWLQQTFGDSHGDIVYVAGNPMTTRHRPDAFHELIEAWRDGYDPDTSVIDPETVTEAGLTAREEFPQKRLIVHYMQPHYPFIDRPDLNYANFDFDSAEFKKGGRSEHEAIHHVWDALRASLVDADAVWEGYRHTLEVVMEEVDELIDSIDDRIVLTSDHGNMLGGRAWPVPLRTYGHPNNQRLTPLIRVPWGIVTGERREITTDAVSSASRADTAELNEQLKHLGYVDE
jgi:hypothetical protein